MQRSWEKMKDLEGKLSTGMTANGLALQTQATLTENISFFALHGFPESHAASFVLIACSSACFKVKYLAAFTCAIRKESTLLAGIGPLNNLKGFEHRWDALWRGWKAESSAPSTK